MPAPQHYRLTYSGVFGTRALPVEIWSHGIAMGPVDGSPFLTRSDLEADVATFASRWSELIPRVQGNCHLTEVTLALVDADGHTPRDAGGAFIQAKHVEDTLSGAQTSREPLQITVAVSTQSARSGPTGRGRFYLPSPLLGVVGDDGRLSETIRDDFQLKAAAFVRAVNLDAIAGGYGTCVVASGGSPSAGLAPALLPIIGIKVGRAVDTQRRRRGDIPEDAELVLL